MQKGSVRQLTVLNDMLLQLRQSDLVLELSDAQTQLAFETAFAAWWRQVLRKTSHRGRSRLDGGLSHASLYFLRFVWWPAFRSLSGLIPEFEIVDYKDGYRYIDFVYLTNGLRIAIELDGRGPHRLHISAAEFEDELMRQNYLVLDRWLVLRFPYLMLQNKPRQCQQLLQQLLGMSDGTLSAHFETLSAAERRILAYVCRSTTPVAPAHVAAALNMHRNTALKYLYRLYKSGFIAPLDPKHKVIRRYVPERERIPYHYF